MNPLSPPFRADHVGSLLRPAPLLQARQEHAQGTISDAQLRETEHGAIRDVVRMQQDVGLRTATDGEFRRASWRGSTGASAWTHRSSDRTSASWTRSPRGRHPPRS